MAASVDVGWRSLLGFGGRCVGCRGRFPVSVLPEHGEPFAMQVEVRQGEAGAQSVVVFRETPVADLIEAEDAFQDAERMFYLGTHTRINTVLCSL